MKKYTGKYKKLSAGIAVIGLALCSVALAQTSPESTTVEKPSQTVLEQQAPENNSAAQPAQKPTSIESIAENTLAPAATVPTNAIQKPITALPQTPRISSGASLLNLALGLGLILLLIFALAWLARRMGQGGMLNNSHIKVVAAMPLGTRERLLVVDVAGQQLLLGITATQINTLHVFPEPVIDKAQTMGHSEFGKKLIAILQQKTPAQAQSSQVEQEKESRS